MFSCKTSRVLKRVAGVAAACGLSAAILFGSGVTAPVAQAAPGDLDAVFATGGTGRYRDIIQWIQWGDYETQFKGKAKPDVPVLDYGQTKTFNNVRNVAPGTELHTTCTLSNLQHLGHNPKRDDGKTLTDAQAKGPLVATIPGGWAGDVLDNLYNVGGPGSWSDGSQTWSPGKTYPKDYVNRNQMVIGLGNGYAYNGNNAKNSNQPWGTPGTDPSPTGYSSQVSFEYSCSASLVTASGTREVPIQGLVFADAEASSKRSGRVIHGVLYDKWGDEWVQASTTQNVTWRVLDRLRSENCGQVTANAEISNGGKTLRLMPTGDECVYQYPGTYTQPNGIGGPGAVMLMEGATSATITIQGAGYSAVALGLVLATDFGDAPESYGNAGSLYEPSWRDGAVTGRKTDVFSNNVTLASMHVGQSASSLGLDIDAEPYQAYSDDARGDDRNTDDEDGITGSVRIPAAPGLTWSQQVACTGDGELYGWIDWNRNGTFEDAERSGWQDANHDGQFEASERGLGPACSNGVATLTWTIPEDVSVNQASPWEDVSTFMRLRITKDRDPDGAPIQPGPTGITAHGEVEDYQVSLYPEAMVKLVKKVDNSSAYTPDPLAPDQWTLTATQNGKTRNGDGVLDPAAVVPGTVTFTETGKTDAARNGYTWADTTCTKHPQMTTAMTSSVSPDKKSLQVKNRDWVVCTLTNKPKPAVVEWSKVDAKGKKLAGSEWNLKGPGFPGGLSVSDCTSGDCAGSQDQDPTPGHFKVEVKKWGDYNITETTAPTGYVAATGEFAFETIDKDHLRVALKDATGVSNGGVVNQSQTGSVTWNKADAANLKPLAGSSWTLTGPTADTPAQVVTDCVAAEASGCADQVDKDPLGGAFRVEGLGLGNYTLKEKAAPTGYKLDSTTTHDFELTAAASNYAFSAPFTNEQTSVPALPLTGGLGADAFVIGGGIVGAAAMGFGMVRRRRQQLATVTVR